MQTVGYTMQLFDRGYRHGGVQHPWFWLVFFFMVAIGVAVLIWALVRSSRPTDQMRPPGPPTDPALEALRMRFAQGEIDGAEYATRAAQLSGVVPSTAPPPGPPPDRAQ